MPNAYASIHDQLIDNYMDTSEPRIIGKETQVYALNKDGYIVPSQLLLKILPNLDEGVFFFK